MISIWRQFVSSSSQGNTFTSQSLITKFTLTTIIISDSNHFANFKFLYIRTHIYYSSCKFMSPRHRKHQIFSCSCILPIICRTNITGTIFKQYFICFECRNFSFMHFYNSFCFQNCKSCCLSFTHFLLPLSTIINSVL